MSDLANTVANQTGISSELAQKGLGALLSFLKEHLGDETFGKVESAIPGVEQMISNFTSSPEASKGGLFETVSAIAGKLFGGKAEEGAKLLASLTKLGFQPEQIQAFLHKALELIKSYLPPELLEQVMAKLPGLAKQPGSETT
jgi:hypothetical protein